MAYVLLWYPLFTQPFIFREVEGLKEHLPLTVYSLYARNLRHCSTEMRAAADSVRTFGIDLRERLARLEERFIGKGSMDFSERAG